MRSVGEFFVGLNRRVRKLAGDEAGSPAVEFALVFPIFIAIVLATLQAGTIFLVKAFFEIFCRGGGEDRSHQSDRLLNGGAVPDRDLQSADRALQLR